MLLCLSLAHARHVPIESFEVRPPAPRIAPEPIKTADAAYLALALTRAQRQNDALLRELRIAAANTGPGYIAAGHADRVRTIYGVLV